VSRHVSDDRLGAIHLKLTYAIRKKAQKQYLMLNDQVVVEGRDMIALLDELRRRRQDNGKMGAFPLGKTAVTLMSMKVGESVELDPVTPGSLSCARNTARKKMGVANAVWRSKTQANGKVRVMRMPDGSPVHDDIPHPVVAKMAAMKIGEVVTIKELPGKMHNGVKVNARRIMGKADANWRCQNLANGHIRCVRVA
jgi:hypothetical protein